MISAKGDDAGERLTILCGTLFLGVSGWRAREDAVVALFDLVEGPCVVVPATSKNQYPAYEAWEVEGGREGPTT